MEKLLDILVLQSCVVFGFYLCLLLIVCLFGFFEDVDEVFTLGRLVVWRWGSGEHTVETTFPDLLIIVTVSMRGILAVLIKILTFEGQLQWV